MANGIISILFCGVGGQGVLLASDLTCLVALKAGLDVKKSEVHGMAQRGGNVDSHVRFGKKVHSPLIPQGEVSVLVGLERVEPLRWGCMLNKDSAVLINAQRIESLFTATGLAEYPPNAAEAMQQAFSRTKTVDALALAKKAGNVKAVNTVMLGMLAHNLAFPKELWLSVIRENVKPKLIDVNIAAFELGYAAAHE